MKWPNVDSIDVIDKQKLSKFQNELERWKDILAGDAYSIQNQLLEIAWQDGSRKKQMTIKTRA